MKILGIRLCFLLILIWCWSNDVNGEDLLENVDVEGYYWRDYLGNIPHDAIEGGPDGNGDTMYIGQTVFTGLKGPILVPGQINAENKTLTFEWGKVERTATKNIKILCSNHPQRFEWLRTTTDNIVRLNNESLVLGGFEGGYTVYIGRVMSGGQLTIAKVNVADGKALLHATKDGKDDYQHKFEILNYNRHIPLVEKIAKAVERFIEATPAPVRRNAAVNYSSSVLGIIIAVVAFLLT